MNYLSVCSGIEAATVAWHGLGWNPVALSEIEKFPCQVLNHHYPQVPNLGDMTKFHEWPNLDIQLLAGGTPCQAFSVAGLREGLADPRGNLTLTFLGVAAKYRPRWLVWENVPGVLSDRTNAFGQFLAGVGQLGYGWAYRVLDAQYFGLAQRRKRVFVVGCLGGWQRAAAVLFESESLSGNPAPRREAGQGIAPTLSARTKGGGGLGTDADLDGAVIRDDRRGLAIPIQEIGKRHSGTSVNGVGHGQPGDPMYTLQRGAIHGIAHSLKAEGFDASEDGTGRGTPIVPWPAQIAPTLNASFGDKQGLEDQHALNGGGCLFPPKISRCLNAGAMGRLDYETETLLPMRRGGSFDDAAKRFRCCNCSRHFGVPDYPRNPTCPDCRCMTVDDLLQGDIFPERTELAFAEPGSPNNPDPICFSSKDHGADAGPISPTLRSGNHTASHANAGVPPAIAFHPTQDPINSVETTHALGCRSRGGQASAAVAFQESQSGCREYPESGTQRAAGPGHDPVGTRIRDGMQVRRLTPLECERLQGFPDNYTQIPIGNKSADKCPDGPRYKALGNSMAVPCMHWIGRRIQQFDGPLILEDDE